MTVVLMAGPGDSTHIVYNALIAKFDVTRVILENRVSRKQLLGRRVKRLGWPTVAGQTAFQALAVPLMTITSRMRIQRIKEKFGLDDSTPPVERTIRVTSANSEGAIAALKLAEPSVVVVNGTRILSKAVLSSVEAPFINLHTGITPAYRGVHVGYWALAERRPDLFGVTVHVVDEGIDTGGVVAQTTLEPEPADNFVTYPYLQLAAALPLLEKAVGDALAGAITLQAPAEGRSRLYYHPTLGQYLRNRLRYGIR
jgi:folate-dependent phosphoribosylglycinamide formyltransferase PurN